jgi:hypothetical protein
MRRILALTFSALLGSAVATVALPETAAHAQTAHGVALGAGAGVAVPNGTPDFKAAFNWGFFVDIPLIYTFHITPSALLYRLKATDTAGTTLYSTWATDISLNFKFVVPLGFLQLFGGVLAGLTARQSIDPHVGALAGLSINLISNIDIFAQANYRIILPSDGGTIRDLQVYAGPLFRF